MRQNNLFKNSILNTVGTVVYVFFQWLATLIVARVSGFEDAGIYSLSSSFTVVFYVIACLSNRSYQISDVMHRHTDGTYIAARLLACLLSILLFSAALFFVDFSNYVIVCCIAMMFYKFTEQAGDVFGGVMQKLNRYDCIALSYILRGIIPTVAFTVVLYLKDLRFAIFTHAIISIVIFFLYDVQVVMRNKNFTSKVVLHDIPHIFFASLPLMISSFVYPYMMFITRYLISGICSAEELGYYSSIVMFVSVMGFIIAPMLNSFLPRISERYLNRQNNILKDIIIRVICCILLFTLLLLGGVFAFGKFGLSLLFGDEILPFSFLLSPVIIYSCILNIASFLSSVLISFQKRTHIMISNLVSILPFTLLLHPLINKFGMIGSLYCLMIGTGIQIAVSSLFIIITLKLKT